ncbi:ester cyclase [Longibacter salinarum]|nr:ester cyclase [Longibacter salinarum]
MSTNPSRDVAQRFVQVWNAGRLDVIDDVAASEIIVDYPHFPEPLRGEEAFRKVMEKTYRFFPDLEIEVQDLVAGEEKAAVRWTYRGTHTTGEMFGVEADGTVVEVSGLSMYEIERGRVVSDRGVVDNLGLMDQLGAR